MNRSPFLSMTLILALSSIVPMIAGAPKQGQLLSMSIPKLCILKGERVVGFEFHVTSGRIVAIPNVPLGWNITVDNDPSWKTSIHGAIAVGAAAVDSLFFKGFISIEKDESLGIPFDVKGEVVVSEDFEHERRIQIGMKDLVISPSRTVDPVKTKRAS